MPAFVVYNEETSENLGEVSAPDALGALDFFAKEQGYTGYDRNAFDAEEWIIKDYPNEALVFFENTELRAVQTVRNENADRCAVCGGQNPGDITHTRC